MRKQAKTGGRTLKPKGAFMNGQWYLLVIAVGIFFIIILFISILMGFHPPQPDTPLISRAYHRHVVPASDAAMIAEQSQPTSPTIFIGLPTLNDDLCGDTIISAFDNSDYPDSLFIGVHQQTDLNAYPDCMANITQKLNCPSHVLCSRLWHIRITRTTSNNAKGPTWGRYMADKKYNGEEFVLITDSHTFFRPHWDSVLMDLWKSINNEYAVISHYPKGDDLMQSNLDNWQRSPNKAMSYHICGTIFENSVNHIPRNANGCYLRVRDLTKPVLVPFWAAGFSFSKAHIRKQVPWDPHTKWLFHGEEFNFASRAWTHGYDFYSPPFDILFHRYADRAKRGHMPYSSEIAKERDRSEKRLNALWGLLDVRTPAEKDKQKANVEDLDKYGLGDKRTIEQFWEFCGVNATTMGITVFEKSRWEKGGLTRVPWNAPHIDPMAS